MKTTAKKINVITLGVAVVDIVAYPADKGLFERDNTPIDDILITIGGDAVNQSVNLAALGSSVSLSCRVGDDKMGALLISELQSHGVITQNVAVSGDSVTSTAIVLVAKDSDRHIICKKGNNYDFCIDDINMNAIGCAKALSIASIYGIPKLEAHGLKEILQLAKANNVLTFADMGSDKKNQKLKGVTPFLPYIDFFMPSLVESTHLTGESNVVFAAKMFKDAGSNGVIIKLGAKGAYCDCDAFTGYVNPFRVTPVDTTGAGDAFCAGFIHSMLHGTSVIHSLEFASACGAMATQQLGACNAAPSEAQVTAFIANQKSILHA